MIRSRNVDSKGIEGDEGAIMLEDRITCNQTLPFIVKNDFNNFQPPKSTNFNPQNLDLKTHQSADNTEIGNYH